MASKARRRKGYGLKKRKSAERKLVKLINECPYTHGKSVFDDPAVKRAVKEYDKAHGIEEMARRKS